MKHLVEILTNQTQYLKETFVERSKQYAAGEYAQITRRRNWNEAEYCEFLHVKPVWANGSRRGLDGPATSHDFLTFPNGSVGQDARRKYYRLRDETSRVCRLTVAEFVERAEKKAVAHYENSIKKLAARILKKGLDINAESLEVETATVDENITTVITDGHNTVRAWTIVAGGPIQRPHYRYLVK